MTIMISVKHSSNVREFGFDEETGSKVMVKGLPWEGKTLRRCYRRPTWL